MSSLLSESQLAATLKLEGYEVNQSGADWVVGFELMTPKKKVVFCGPDLEDVANRAREQRGRLRVVDR